MRTLTVTIILMVLAVPAYAGDIDRTERGTPILIREDVDTEFRYDIIGHYFVVTHPDGAQTSTEVPEDAVAYDLADDGTVTFTTGEPEPEPVEPVADVSADEWDDYVESGGDTGGFHHSADTYPF